VSRQKKIKTEDALVRLAEKPQRREERLSAENAVMHRSSTSMWQSRHHDTAHGFAQALASMNYLGIGSDFREKVPARDSA
jgi:hypothetical protein